MSPELPGLHSSGSSLLSDALCIFLCPTLPPGNQNFQNWCVSPKTFVSLTNFDIVRLLLFYWECLDRVLSTLFSFQCMRLALNSRSSPHKCWISVGYQTQLSGQVMFCSSIQSKVETLFFKGMRRRESWINRSPSVSNQTLPPFIVTWVSI